MVDTFSYDNLHGAPVNENGNDGLHVCFAICFLTSMDTSELCSNFIRCWHALFTNKSLSRRENSWEKLQSMV